MDAPNPSLTQELHGALAWWQLAGVDCDFADDATDWLERGDEIGAVSAPKPSPEAARTPEPAPTAKEIERTDLLGPNPPSDLAAFREFWLTAPGLDSIGPRGRVAPHGPANPDLMVLVIDPEQEDRERLLSGPQGRLLSKIIAAMGLEEGSIYFASALPRHTPMADTPAIAASGLDAVTAHHVDLVAPNRLLAFGANIPPLLGHGLANDISHLREINQTSRSVPLMVSEGLESLMVSPKLKARFWRRWIEWSA